MDLRLDKLVVVAGTCGSSPRRATKTARSSNRRLNRHHQQEYNDIDDAQMKRILPGSVACKQQPKSIIIATSTRRAMMIHEDGHKNELPDSRRRRLAASSSISHKIQQQDISICNDGIFKTAATTIPTRSSISPPNNNNNNNNQPKFHRTNKSSMNLKSLVTLATLLVVCCHQPLNFMPHHSSRAYQALAQTILATGDNNSNNLLFNPADLFGGGGGQPNGDTADSATGSDFPGAVALDSSRLGPSGSQLDNSNNNLFSSRQGQLAPLAPLPVADPQRRPANRQQQQQPPQQPQRTRQQVQPDQLRNANPNGNGLGVGELQPRFQRLRTPPGNAPNPIANQPDQQFLANPQFAPQQPNNPQRLSQPGGPPTLSAFDLSSLANLANQPQLNGANQQQQPPFRRLQNQQQHQQAPSGARQVPNAPQVQSGGFNPFVPPPPPQTELPFIRQVFRPSSPEESNQPAELSNARPTPPPLFVPPDRPTPVQPQVNKVSRLVETGGFSPIRAANEVFFEPNGARQLPPPQRLAATANRQQQQQPRQPAIVNEATRKPQANRRPSQRPQLPQLPQQQQSTVRAPATGSPLAQAAQDVIRLASSAISSANEGLATAPGVLATTQPSNDEASFQPSTVGSIASSNEAQPASSSSTTLAGSDFVSTSTSTPSSFTSTATSPNRQQQPLRTSANFFTLATGTTSASPTSFSPALPINAAVAASGGRRRIPVRNPVGPSRLQQQQQQQQQQVQNQQPTTQSSSAPVQTTTPVAPVNRQPQQQQSGRVRRPGIEEFYETISGALASPTTIDGFGAPSRGSTLPSASSSTTTLATTASQNDQSATTLPATSDLYGSRLTGTGQLSAINNNNNNNNNNNFVADSTTSESPAPLNGDSNQPTTTTTTQPLRVAVEEEVKPAAAPVALQPQGNNNNQEIAQAAPVVIPVTYMTTLTYLTTVLHGTHTLETSHESVVRSTELATLNAQLMDQIEHSVPLIQPTATVGVSSKTKGKGTTIVNLKSAISAYNQELVDALAGGGSERELPLIAASVAPAPVQPAAAPATREPARQQFLQPNRANKPRQSAATRTLDLSDLSDVKKNLYTEYVYSYTIRPQGDGNNPQAEATTSVRSELVPASVGEQADLLLTRLMKSESANLIDSNGFMRLNNQQQAGALNLGSTLGKDGLAMTEVNMIVASYIKFDGVTNVMLQVKPTRVADLDGNNLPGNQMDSSTPPTSGSPVPLDTSFDVHFTSLNNALDRLDSTSNGQTPSLDLALQANIKPTAKIDDLLRSQTQADQPLSAPTGSRLASSSNSASVRSQLRSRVASSRLRNQIQPQASQPALSSGSVSVPAAASQASAGSQSLQSLTPSVGSSRAIRPIKSRVVRPPVAVDSADFNQASSAIQIQPTRSSKPRFVVVTRTGQFGVRATPSSSLQQQQQQQVPSSVADLPQSETVASQPPLATVRVSSRFSKSNRFRGPTQTRLAPIPDAPTSAIAPSSTDSAPAASVVAPNESDRLAQTTPGSDTTTTGNSNKDAADGSASVIVTYFTTTTHTIPFTINSNTIYTTIEETNSRVATEFMKDLNGHFIEPTPTASLPEPTATGQQLQSAQFESTSQPIASSPAAEDGLRSSIAASSTIEPSFLVTLNTKTYFTTFTYFTTYSAGEATPTIKSSESTTSNIVTETVTSAYEPTRSLVETPQIATSASPSFVLPAQASSAASDLSSEILATQTLLSTMTYYGTVYNGSQTSLTPIVDVSTQVLTLSPSPGFNTNSDLLNSAASSSGDIQPSSSIQEQPTVLLPLQSASPSSVNDVDRITRTKSMYTTLTHYITFYSGTKTQLSSIQEISPTVVTEYIDRTLFEQQQAQLSQADSSVIVVPQQGNPIEGVPTQPVMTLTPSPVMPQLEMTATQVDATTTRLPSTDPTSQDTTTSMAPSTSEGSSPSSEQPSSSSTQPATTTTESVESKSVQVGDKQAQQPSQNQMIDSGAEAKTLPSSDQSLEGKQAAPTNIIELSDLIASNSSASGSRVALASNLNAAIKDIVQLLAGNKTITTQATSGQDVSSMTPPMIVEPTGQTTLTPKRQSTSRLYGQKAREQQQLQGSISSPALPASTVAADYATTPASSSAKTTPELSSTLVNGNQQRAAATIFFSDDGGDERKKLVKTVWPASQSTIYLTSIEPSTRFVINTTTKVYYTRDSPLTITSSFTSVIAPRTFVSTIMGTRTLVNQLNTQAVVSEQSPVAKAPQPAVQPSRQDVQAAQHRLSVQQKQQKQMEQQQKKIQAAATASAKAKQAAASQQTPIAANINQCQPMCKVSNNEMCKFHPAAEPGAPGTFACDCRPGYHMVLHSNGQRQCQEVQSYVVLLRLLQVGDQSMSFKRELQDKSSSEFRSMSHVIRDHVKRAYMTSDLVRDRFVSVDIMNYARSLSVQPTTTSTSTAALPTGGRQPIAVNTSTLVDPMNSGIIVNMTIQLQPPAAGVNEVLDEGMLKEELTKKLNLRQAAALAAQAAKSPPSPDLIDPSASSSSSSTSMGAGSDPNSANSTVDEALPNPFALFLADVEQVMDLDECANPSLNDCHEGAVCINEIGSYRCDCREYPDLNPLHPGRQCANELKSCDFCNNRGDCVKMPSLHPASSVGSHNSSQQTLGNGKGQPLSTVCQCHRIYLGRRCEINGLLLATLLPIAAILLIVSVCLVIYCCRRWRRRSSLSKGFRNIGTFGPAVIGGTLDRKAMLESSSESSDTHQRPHHLRAAAAAAAAGALYDVHHHHHHHSGMQSDPSSGSSNESSPRQIVRSQMVMNGASTASDDTRQHQQQGGPPYCASIPPQIVIPRARHNQVNYAVHRGQVYMW